MSTNQTHEQYVASILGQFDAFCDVAIQAWPHVNAAPTSADFRAARYELLKMLNERRDKDGIESPANDGKSEPEQYLPMTPAPWP